MLSLYSTKIAKISFSLKAYECDAEKFLSKILIAIHAVGDVRIDFQYQEMPLPVMPINVRNCERKKFSSNFFC